MVSTDVTYADVEIEEHVTRVLARNQRLEFTSLEVEADDGAVTLRGIVPTVWQKKLAEKIARRVPGVQRVLNDLKVHPTAFWTDADITETIRAVLARDLRIDEQRVSVRSRDGIVELEGTADTYAQRAAIEAAAWAVGGVMDLANNLTVVALPPRVTDDQIAADLKATLDRNLKLDLSRIDVHVVQSRAYLRGQVSTLLQKVLVEDCAWWTPGVRSVVNILMIQVE